MLSGAVRFGAVLCLKCCSNFTLVQGIGEEQVQHFHVVDCGISLPEKNSKTSVFRFFFLSNKVPCSRRIPEFEILIFV